MDNGLKNADDLLRGIFSHMGNVGLDRTATPSPHNPLGAKGMGESPTITATPAIVNAVVDALAHLGVTHVDIPIKSETVWRILKEKGVAN